MSKWHIRNIGGAVHSVAAIGNTDGLPNISTQLAEIHRRCFQDQHWDESSFDKMLLNPSYFGLIIRQENDGIDCGFIIWQHIFNEAEIITFCVKPEYRGLGAGRCLLVAMKENIMSSSMAESNGDGTLSNPKIFLEVSEDNAAAIHLYQSVGFAKISERKAYYKRYGISVNALVMSCINCSNYN